MAGSRFLDINEMVRDWTTGPWVRLAHIDRYSSVPVLHKESVAEHSFFTALLAYNIANDLRINGKFQVDLRLVLHRAISHDLDEALTGDFIRPFKYSSPELKRVLTESVSSAMVRALGKYPMVLEAWENAKGDDEGAIVHLADFWSVVIYARREFLLGNSYARGILAEVAVWIERGNWPVWLEPYAGAIQAMAKEAADEFAGARVRLRADKEMQDPFHEDMLRVP